MAVTVARGTRILTPSMRRSDTDLNSSRLLGRTFEEYIRYFGLQADDLRGKTILDMGGGVSSFCAEANERGLTVTAADPAYGLDVGRLEGRCRADLDAVCGKLPGIMHQYEWSFYRDVAHMRTYRERAYHRFLIDYQAHPDHYRYDALPETSLAERSFDLSLVSYFLFLYEDRFDYEFHRASVVEMARITRGEIRIFPIVNLHGEHSRFIDRLRADPALAQCVFEEHPTDFRFLLGATSYLRILTNPPMKKWSGRVRSITTQY
jgi:hypothetical protein